MTVRKERLDLYTMKMVMNFRVSTLLIRESEMGEVFTFSLTANGTKVFSRMANIMATEELSTKVETCMKANTIMIKEKGEARTYTMEKEAIKETDMLANTRITKEKGKELTSLPMAIGMSANF